MQAGVSLKGAKRKKKEKKKKKKKRTEQSRVIEAAMLVYKSIGENWER